MHLSDWLDKEVTQGEEVDTEVIRTEITEVMIILNSRFELYLVL